MKKLWRLTGRTAFWAAWPALWIYLRNSRRTRVLVYNDKRELLVVHGWLSGTGKWMLPGGGLHRGEDPVAGAIRELGEETGLVCTPSQLRSAGQRQLKSNGFVANLLFYAVEVNAPLLSKHRSFEITDIEWVAISELTARTAENDVLLGIEQLAPSR